jgi:hypothetical protein
METGLPSSDIPVALVTFNLGVEAGQLIFIAVVLLIIRVFHAAVRQPLPALRTMTAYAIGTASMFWLITRLAGFAA